MNPINETIYELKCSYLKNSHFSELCNAVFQPKIRVQNAYTKGNINTNAYVTEMKIQKCIILKEVAYKTGMFGKIAQELYSRRHAH